ncbi:MAG: pitrilysin family protein [Candidatus Shapirobacteria bacterium]|jgi:predicted Zn-dependent peptidase
MKTKIFKLKNGITGVIVPILGLKSVTVEVFLKIGSKYELKDEFGMSHFLEHMAFKGTNKRPTASVINQEIDSKGASYNAGTGHEMTSYHITTTKENISWAVEMLADILINSIYDSHEVLKERGVIMEEIRMYQDNPMMGLSGEMTKFLYGKSKIGCWDIAGEIKDIENVNRQKVNDFRNKFINPNELVVVIVGNVDFEAYHEVEKYFSTLENKSKLVLPKVEISLSKDRKKEFKKEVKQGHFAMAVPAISWNDKRKYAFKLLDIVLNGNASSRLYQKIREDKALAYYVFSISETFAETGFWGVQSGVKLEKIDEAMDIVKQEIKKIADNLKESELIRAKDYLIGKLELAMDNTNYWSGFVGQKLLLEKKLETIGDELNRYRKVDLKELKSLAKEIFKEQEIRQVVIKK